jgi:hypothetical protein
MDIDALLDFFEMGPSSWAKAGERAKSMRAPNALDSADKRCFISFSSSSKGWKGYRIYIEEKKLSNRR